MKLQVKRQLPGIGRLDTRASVRALMAWPAQRNQVRRVERQVRTLGELVYVMNLEHYAVGRALSVCLAAKSIALQDAHADRAPFVAGVEVSGDHETVSWLRNGYRWYARAHVVGQEQCDNSVVLEIAVKQKNQARFVTAARKSLPT